MTGFQSVDRNLNTFAFAVNQQTKKRTKFELVIHSLPTIHCVTSDLVYHSRSWVESMAGTVKKPQMQHKPENLKLLPLIQSLWYYSQMRAGLSPAIESVHCYGYLNFDIQTNAKETIWNWNWNYNKITRRTQWISSSDLPFAPDICRHIFELMAYDKITNE